jgi:succinate dehydrogenase/fumarate reductase flavoprotein subunit
MITELPDFWDNVADVVVVGSGGAALTAATLAADGGSSVAIVEKADMIGGTTAVSGGVLWVPNNAHMLEAGMADSREEALEYVRHLAMGLEPDGALLEVFVDTAPVALAYLEENTPLEMTSLTQFPDYYFPYDVPGKKPGGRSVEPVPFPFGQELPDWRHRLVSRGTLMSLGSYTTLAEDLFSPADQAELARREAADIRSKGAALIGCLWKGLLTRSASIRLGTRARELVVVDGVVCGVRAEAEGADVMVGARRGVVLACGGFEWNRQMVRDLIGYEVHPLSPPNNVGDGLVMAADAGAELVNVNSYWGTPAMFDPAIVENGEPVPQFEGGRGMPGSIVVNGRGRRFANEGVPYNDFPRAFGEFDASRFERPNTAPAWLVFDHQAKESVQILSMVPGAPAPEWVARATTIGELARRIDIDPESLEQTVTRYNAGAAEGVDPDFDRHRLGLMGAGPLRPIGDGPYYAIAMYPGTLGTNGGPKVDVNAQVVRRDGQPIGRLYAVGNTAANAFGWAYPSGGATIGHGVTFGYLAGRHAATQPVAPMMSQEAARAG